MEIWKDIHGFEGLYQVSNQGKIRSRNSIRKTPISSNGYKIVKLCNHGTIKFCLVHRLVAEAFIPNPNQLRFVNHKDRNRTNNSADNLEWCTQQYNNEYSLSKKILQMDRNGVVVFEWASIKDASAQLHIDGSFISKCCLHKRKSAGGYVWKYKKEA
jgi:hypothetical protein